MGCFFQRVRPYKLLYNHLLAEPSFVICGAFLMWKVVCGGLFIIRGASFSHWAWAVLFLLYSCDLVLAWLKRGHLLNEVTVSTWVPPFWGSLCNFSSFDCFKHGSNIEWVRTRYSERKIQSRESRNRSCGLYIRWKRDFPWGVEDWRSK